MSKAFDDKLKKLETAAKEAAMRYPRFDLAVETLGWMLGNKLSSAETWTAILLLKRFYHQHYLKDIEEKESQWWWERIPTSKSLPDTNW